MKINELVETYINGNIATARKYGKRRTHSELRDAFQDVGYSLKKATLTADFLKTGRGFQAACDAE